MGATIGSAAGLASDGLPRRWLVPWLLALPVAAAHLGLATLWPEDRHGLGERESAPTRIEVAFVRELQPAAPPAPPPVATRRLPAVPPARPASAADSMSEPGRDLGAALPPVSDAALPEPTALAEALPEVASVPAPDMAVAVAPIVDAASSPSTPTASTTLPPAAPASAATAFEWPPSTRLSYRLTGNYRGPVEGQARVEWRLAGQRYQVALEVGIGPPFAPIVTRELLSDGLVTPAGLEPRRYDEETRVAFRAPRRLSIALDADRVLLPNGRQFPRPAGLQDSASQFVQMTWLFTMQPARLATGSTLDVPLALPRHVEVWTYEVLGPTTLETPVGLIDAVHVRPRLPPRLAGRGGGDLVAEFWVAPSLQNLPVRILIRQDEETYVDLHLERLPQQAAPGR